MRLTQFFQATILYKRVLINLFVMFETLPQAYVLHIVPLCANVQMLWIHASLMSPVTSVQHHISFQFGKTALTVQQARKTVRQPFSFQMCEHTVASLRTGALPYPTTSHIFFYKRFKQVAIPLSYLGVAFCQSASLCINIYVQLRSQTILPVTIQSTGVGKQLYTNTRSITNGIQNENVQKH